MQHRYNRERDLPIVIETTVDELRLISLLAEAVAKLDEMPKGVWESDLRTLTTNVKGVLNAVAYDAHQHFKRLRDDDFGDSTDA